MSCASTLLIRLSSHFADFLSSKQTPFFITFTVLRPTRRLQLADHVSNFVSPIGGGVASKWPAGDDTAS